MGVTDRFQPFTTTGSAPLHHVLDHRGERGRCGRTDAVPAAYPFFTLAVVYGMRRGEISALRWEDVDFEAEHLSVRATLVCVGGQLVRGPVKPGPAYGPCRWCH